MEIKLHDDLRTCNIEFDFKVLEPKFAPFPTIEQMDPSAILTL